MTVVSTLISRAATAHATDSLISSGQEGQYFKKDEWEKPKIVQVRTFRGAMSYWGLTGLKEKNWFTLQWLKQMAGLAGQCVNPEPFALLLGKEVEIQLNKLELPNNRNRGIGIHFSAYEWVKGQWVPELFLITNWTDALCNSANPEGVRVTRETFSKITGIKKDLCTSEENQRLVVHQFLQAGHLLSFNNGDPILFNPAAEAFMNMFNALSIKNDLKDPSEPFTTKSLVKNSMELVSLIQVTFCRNGTSLVGGKPNVLGISPTGQYI